MTRTRGPDADDRTLVNEITISEYLKTLDKVTPAGMQMPFCETYQDCLASVILDERDRIRDAGGLMGRNSRAY